MTTSERRPSSGTHETSLPVSTGERPALALSHEVPDVHLRGDELGRTYTRDPVARVIVGHLARRGYLTTSEGTAIRSAWEPCVGGGAFVRAIRSVVRSPVYIGGTDLDPDAPGFPECDEGTVGDCRDVYSPPRGMPITPVGFDAATGHAPAWVDLAITNPPFGLKVGQEVTEGIVAAARRVAVVTAILLPLDYQTQAGFEEHVGACAAIWPLLPRPFSCERGMAVYVWDRRRAGPTAFEQLRWRVGGTAHNLGGGS